MHRFTASLALTITLGLATAACSSGGSNGAASQPPTANGLARATTTFGKAILTQDASASYSFLTKACHKKMSLAKWSGQLVVGIALIEGFAKVKASDLSVGKVETRNVRDRKGESTLQIRTKDGSNFNDSKDWQKWAYEDGSWRATDCSQLGTDSSSGTATTTTTRDVVTTTDFADAPLQRTVNGATYHDVTYDDAFTGAYTVSLVATRDFGTTIASGYSDPATAKGHYVGVKFTVKNDTNGDLSMTSAFSGNARISDGKASWGSDSDATFRVTNNELPDADSTVGAGFTDSAWVVYDVPSTVTPVGLIYGMNADHPLAFGLPPVG